MTKDDLLELLSIKTASSKALCLRFVDAFVEIIKESVTHDKRIMIKNFGIFEARMSKEKIQNGQFSKKPKVIKPSKRLKFKSSKNFNSKIN